MIGYVDRRSSTRRPTTTNYVTRLARVLAARRIQGSNVWSVFDDAARGAATENALDLSHRPAVVT